MALIQVPSFNFGSFYYPQLLQALILFKRANLPELTDESEFEPTIQLIRMFALVGHLNNVLADTIANESTLKTARIPEQVRDMMTLIGYELSPATPSRVDLLYKLNSVPGSGREIVPENGQASTQRGLGEDPVIFFESIAGVTVTASNVLEAVFSITAADVAVDHTTAANAGSGFTPWASGMTIGSALYFGHSTTLWDQLDLEISTPSAITDGAWEFFDGNTDAATPSAVVNVGGGSLQFDLTSLLGPDNRAGAVVVVKLLDSGARQEVVSTWNGSINIATTSLLGQSIPSTDSNFYVVGSEWREMLDISDGSNFLAQDGALTYTLPQDLRRNWRKTTVNGFEGYFIRLRIIDQGASTSPLIGQVEIDNGKQYVVTEAIQGRSVGGETLGSSTGEKSQRFPTANDHFIKNSQTVFVNSVEWTEVDNFLDSASQDNHYVVELGADDRATIVFGDGDSGRIPPIGQANLQIDYRHDAADNGNVGPGTINVDKSGLSFVDSIINPRQASGWAEGQADSDEGIARAKIEGPAALRVRNTGIGPDDISSLAIGFTDVNGSKPFSRAQIIEEGFGPKTVKTVVVARGGAQATSGQLEELDTYLNGDKTANPPVPKRIVVNSQSTAVNFIPHTINVEALVEAPSSITAIAISNALAALLQPEALEDDGVTYVWKFGGEVPLSRISHEIHKVSALIRKVRLIGPTGDELLGGTELPISGTFNITVAESI